MAKKVNTAFVKIWGRLAGAVAWDEDRNISTFQYAPEFINQGLDVSPLEMPISRSSEIFSFRGLSRTTFNGLPGLLADSLPDKFGNQLIDAWLARQGRSSGDFNPVERLCYIGNRGMGALEFTPVLDKAFGKSVPVEIQELVKFADEVLRGRESLEGSFSQSDLDNALTELIRVGTSAGGARAKAVIAVNPATGKVKSGQVSAGAGFEYWILKFDGLTNNLLGDPRNYGRIEYAYYLMALEAGIDMTESRLLEENGRAHFMTRRFDRHEGGEKTHMQSLCAIAHYDFNEPGAYTYEQALRVMDRLRLSYQDKEQLFRRAVFNIIARNQDDHTKNISFLMDKDRKWKLAPAYDMTYCFNHDGVWTSQHQMRLNGKRDEFTYDDLASFAKANSLKKHSEIIDQVRSAVNSWEIFAEKAKLGSTQRTKIKNNFRMCHR